MLLKNKVVTVTGGNSGIGKPIVLELARQGANIAADYVSHPDAAEELEERVASLGDHAIGVEADVSKVANLERLIAATNWSGPYLTGDRGVSARGASFALTAFWAMVTIGRILSAALSSRTTVRWIYTDLPVLLMVAFQVVSHAEGETGGIVAFGLAGLGCSAFFPLCISLSGQEFPRLAATMSGELLAFYQAAYGIAAFGVGPLREFIGFPYRVIYSFGLLVAAAILGIALAVVVWEAKVNV